MENIKKITSTPFIQIKRRKKLLFISFIREYEGTHDYNLRKHAILEVTNSVQINTLIGFLRSKSDVASNLIINHFEIFYAWPEYIFNFEGIVENVLKYSPDFILISHIDLDYKVLEMFHSSIYKLLPNSIWIVGGYSITSNPLLLKKKMFHFGIVSHGEMPLYLLLRYFLLGDVRLNEVPNLAYLDRFEKIKLNNINIFPKEESNTKLQFDEFNINHYKKISWQIPPISEMKYLTTWFSRGCSYCCSFCQNKIMNLGNFIFRNPEKIIEEVADMREKFNINFVFFADEDFLVIPNLTSSLIELFEKTFKREVRFTFMTTVNSLNRANEIGLLSKLKNAGCEEIQIGVESGSKYILRKMKKNQNLDETFRAFESVYKNGMMSSAMMVLGHPGETISTLNLTYNFIHDIKPDRISLFFSIPFRGTRLFNEKYSEFPTYLFNTDLPIIPLEEIENYTFINKFDLPLGNYEEIFNKYKIKYSISQRYLEYFKSNLLKDYYNSINYKEKQKNILEKRVLIYFENRNQLLKGAEEWFKILSNTIGNKSFSKEMMNFLNREEKYYSYQNKELYIK